MNDRRLSPRGERVIRLATLLVAFQTPRAAGAQEVKTLTLAQAEDLALLHQPRVLASALITRAENEIIAEARAGYLPTFAGNLTGVLALEETTVTAGALTTSSLSSRAAGGLSLTQLITDFGRTVNLWNAAQLRAKAQEQRASDVRARVILEVRCSYYAALAAEAVERVATATLDTRKLILRQVSALAHDQLKSSLDVSFAEALTSEAELASVQANGETHRSRARLAAAVGAADGEQFILADEPVPPPPGASPDALVARAAQNRPDLQALELQASADVRFAAAEQALHYPTLSLLGSVGVTPWHDLTLAHDYYGAIGVNIAVPIFNGGLFSARHAEAELRAEAARADLDARRLEATQEVRSSWIDTADAYRRLDVTAKLLDEVTRALRLARVRYDTGLGSIVELNQAQLLQTSAAIAVASAKYDYLTRLATLQYATGALTAR